MKSLALSDQVVDVIHTSNLADRFHDINLIVGCGDLPVDYLEFVVSMLNVPLVYVPGNHDRDNYSIPGGIPIDGRLVKISNIRIAGLGGSQRYKPKGKHQYSDTEMLMRVLRLVSSSIIKKPHLRGKIDLFVAHSPPRGIHDGSDLAHRGFTSFHTIFKYLRPTLMLHGHSHVHRNIECTESTVSNTRILNVFPYRVVDFGNLP